MILIEEIIFCIFWDEIHNFRTKSELDMTSLKIEQDILVRIYSYVYSYTSR